MPQYTPSKPRHRCVLKKDPSWQAALRRSRRFRTRCAHRKRRFGQLQSTSKDSLDTYLSSPGSIRLACPMINTDDDPTSQKKVESGAANQRRGMPVLAIKRLMFSIYGCTMWGHKSRTDDEKTSVQLFLIYDRLTNLHRLRSCNMERTG